MKKFQTLMCAVVVLGFANYASACNKNVAVQAVQAVQVATPVFANQYVATPVLVQQPALVANSYGVVAAQSRVISTPVMVQSQVFSAAPVYSTGVVSSSAFGSNVFRNNGGGVAVAAQGRRGQAISATGSRRVIVRQGLFGTTTFAR